MRIAIDYTPAVRQGGGVGRYTRGLVDALARLDIRNEYVLFVAAGGKSEVEAWRGARFRLPALPANFTLKPLPLSDRLLAILWHRLRLPLYIELFTGPVDLFHSPDFVLPPVRRARRLVTVHDLSFLRLPQCAEPGLRKYLSKVVPRSIRRANLVLADSQSTKRDVVELLGVPEGKVRVVPAGVEARFRPVEDEEELRRVAERYGLVRPFILSLSTLEPRKNFTGLIEAYARLIGERKIPHKLVIAGGKGWLYEEIFAAAQRPGLEGRVIFPGFVDDEDLPALYSLADLFAFPSLYEGFGLPPLEAMACGVPVITSNLSSLPEIVGRAGIMLEPDDTEGLAEAMGEALQDEALRRRMIAEGLEQAKKFTWEEAAEKLLETYLKSWP